MPAQGMRALFMASTSFSGQSNIVWDWRATRITTFYFFGRLQFLLLHFFPLSLLFGGTFMVNYGAGNIVRWLGLRPSGLHASTNCLLGRLNRFEM